MIFSWKQIFRFLWNVGFEMNWNMFRKTCLWKLQLSALYHQKLGSKWKGIIQPAMWKSNKWRQRENSIKIFCVSDSPWKSPDLLLKSSIRQHQITANVSELNWYTDTTALRQESIDWASPLHFCDCQPCQYRYNFFPSVKLRNGLVSKASLSVNLLVLLVHIHTVSGHVHKFPLCAPAPPPPFPER